MLLLFLVIVPSGPGGGNVEHIHDKLKRDEVFIVAPRRLQANKAEDIIRGINSAFCPEGKTVGHDWLLNIGKSATHSVVTSWGDGASANQRVLKHFAYIVETWGSETCLLDDTNSCWQHAVQRAKNDAQDLTATVSMFYSLSKLMRSGAILLMLATNIEALVGSMFRYRIGPPPEEEHKHMMTFIDILFDFDAKHHSAAKPRSKKPRARAKKGSEAGDVVQARASQLLADAKFLGSMANAGWTGDFIMHFCFDLSKPNRRCCSSEEESRDKMTPQQKIAAGLKSIRSGKPNSAFRLNR